MVIRGPGQIPRPDLNLCVVNSSLRKSETTSCSALIMQETPLLG
jgi:hypothetical protein